MRIYFVILLIVGFIGFLDATYLTTVHFLDAPPGCGEQGGCEEVTSSEYSTIFGLPIAMFGLLFYLSVIFLSLLWFDRGFSFIPRVLPVLSAPAFLFSGWLVYLMFFVIEAICWYCMGSAASSTIIFITSVALFLKLRKG